MSIKAVFPDLCSLGSAGDDAGPSAALPWPTSEKKNGDEEDEEDQGACLFQSYPGLAPGTIFFLPVSLRYD